MADTVTAAILARHFGVTSRAIGDLVNRKAIKRSGSGFDLEDCTRTVRAGILAVPSEIGNS
jgi:hypothetical protein